MNNTNQHAEGKNAHSAAIGSLLQTAASVWLGAKPTWYTWDHVVKNHWLGLKPSEPLNLASFVNFEDCKQDFVAKFQLESLYSSNFSCIRKSSFFPIPVLNYKAGVICSRGCCMPLIKQSNPSVKLISDMSLPVSWTFTGMIYAGNMIMICKIPCMNRLSSNLCLETGMPLLNLQSFWGLLTVFLFNPHPWK